MARKIKQEQLCHHMIMQYKGTSKINSKATLKHYENDKNNKIISEEIFLETRKQFRASY